MQKKGRQLRHELKFPATAAQCEILRQRFAAVMKPDANGCNYRVTSLYLDDMYMSAYNDKLAGADTRKKYRIRTYGLNPEGIRFECKYKDRDMVSKRSLWITYEEYRKILSGDFTFAWSDKYAGTVLEDASHSNSLVALKPSVIVDYNREAFVNREGNVRFTIDSGLKLGTFSADMLSDEVRYVPITETAAVIELKYDDYLPSFLFDLVQDVGLELSSFSKFLVCREKQSAMTGVNKSLL